MAHPDLDALLNALLPFATEQLQKNGGFLPFGGSVSRDGEVVLAAALPETDDPEPPEIIAILEESFASEASRGEVRAVGICLDGRVLLHDTGKTIDAICVSLEHEAEEAVDVSLPYRKTLLGKYKFDDLIASAAEPKIFNRQ